MRACSNLITNGKIMYWGTSRWSPFELFEAYAKAKEYGSIPPIAEVGEYHWFHREKVELYMAELYNKIGAIDLTYISSFSGQKCFSVIATGISLKIDSKVIIHYRFC